MSRRFSANTKAIISYIFAIIGIAFFFLQIYNKIILIFKEDISMLYTFNYDQKPGIKYNHLNLGGKNPDGVEINACSRYITVGGKPYIPIMGEIHFSRLSSSDWETELIKMKNGGITLISTYLFWIYHEEEEGKTDFTGDNNIRKFVSLCQKLNLNVILRIGPWAHGECRNGGFPDWLIKKNIPLRTNDKIYMEYARKWYTSIYNEIKGLLYKDGGNIIGIQIENELVDNAAHLQALKNLAKEIGFDVPLYTVTGWNSIYGADIPKNEFIPVFGGYPEAPWTGNTEPLPPNPHYFLHPARNDTSIGKDIINTKIEHNGKGIDYDLYPYATCELGGGIQVTNHRRPKITPMDVYAITLCRLGSGNNLPGYYMYHGGTNKIGKLSTFHESRKTGYPNDVPVRSYDFQAPIGEFGIIRPQYYMLRLIHMFINDFMEILAPMDAYFSPEIPGRNDTSSLRYSVRTDKNGGFIFVNNYARRQTLAEHKEVQFSVKTNNGQMVFPEEPISVKNGISAILPFNIMLDNSTFLKYSTCQLMHRSGSTYYFFAIDGIRPEYAVNDKIIPADFDKPIKLRNINIITLHFEDALYFNIEKQKPDISDAVIKETETTITPDMLEKLEVPFTTYKQYTIKPERNSEFAALDYKGDRAMLFNNGTLSADDFYYGDKWIFPQKLLSDNSQLLILDKSEPVYMEI